MLPGMTRAEIAAAAKKGSVGDPAANTAFWLREIALQLAILNERNEKIDKSAL
jgi:hypothetical protein